MGEVLRLSTGRACVLHRPSLPLLSHYHVLALDSDEAAPTEAETLEILWLATRKGRELGRIHFGDAECFSIVYHAGRTRRRPWLHVHILPSRNVAGRRRAFLLLSLRPLLRRLFGRRARKADGGLAPCRA